MTTPDPAALRALLRAAARPVLSGFRARHPEPPTALGFVFALHNVSPQLDLCAHLGPLPEDEEERWNSGDYDFPAGLSGARGELGAAWSAAMAALHAAAAGEGPRGPVYQQIVSLLGQVLLDLRAEGLVPEGVDLNLAEVGDPEDLVARRHAQLRAGRLPDGGAAWAPDPGP
jgi:hypothetical protein